MNTNELKARTKKFAVDIIHLVDSFPKTTAGYTIGKQVIRSATSVAANYRASLRAQSQAHFASKISIVEEEADESLFWLELAVDCDLITRKSAESQLQEADELTAIFTATRRTAKKNIWCV